MTKVSAMWKSRRATGLNSGALALVGLLSTATAVSAQAPTVLCGEVRDNLGAPKAGVVVALGHSKASSSPRTATTSKEGEFIFSNVAPGTYALTYFLEGFKKAVRNGIVVAAGQGVRADMRMEPGTAAVYGRSRTSPGTTFTTAVVEGRVAVRPCKG